MKFIFTLVLISFFSASHAQWTRVTQLPPTDILTLYKHDTTFYAGGRGLVYFSKDKGQTWDSTTLLPFTNEGVVCIAIFHNDLFVGTLKHGIFKTQDKGATWQASNGSFTDMTEFCEWQGNLYASTLGGGVYKLDAATNQWSSFNNGLSSLSANLYAIAANTHTMIAGTLANGLFDRLPDDAPQWDERPILSQLRPSEGVYDMMNVHDSLFIAGRLNFYLSTDNGSSWNVIGNQLSATYNQEVNAKEALLVARDNFNGAVNITNFYYLKKSSLNSPFTGFSTIVDHFTYKVELLDNKLWDASSHGLFYMSLSDLPGISSPDDVDTTTDNGNPVPPPIDPVQYTFSVGNVFPNPVINEAHIFLSLDTVRNVSAHLYDVSGKLISTIADHRQLSAGNTIFSFRMNNESSGIYFLKLVVGDKVFVRKIVHRF